MKSALIVFILLTLATCSLFARTDNCLIHGSNENSNTPLISQTHLNFFIVAPPKKGKPDLAAVYNIIRGRINSLFQKNRLVTIVAKNTGDMSTRVKRRLQKQNALIGTLWFDSHGFYKKGYSLFFIGHDEVNYKTIKDSVFIAPLNDLSSYTDDNSKVVIGSCYGGATYCRKSVYNNDTLHMNGDSLMMGLGQIFKKASILGSESWVMTKPGLFMKKLSVTGHPTRRLFRDIVYQPVWEHVGQWNIYYPRSKRFLPLNAVTMDASGNALSFSRPYTSIESVKRKIDKKLKRLRAGLLDVRKI